MENQISQYSLAPEMLQIQPEIYVNNNTMVEPLDLKFFYEEHVCLEPYVGSYGHQTESVHIPLDFEQASSSLAFPSETVLDLEGSTTCLVDNDDSNVGSVKTSLDTDAEIKRYRNRRNEKNWELRRKLKQEKTHDFLHVVMPLLDSFVQALHQPGTQSSLSQYESQIVQSNEMAKELSDLMQDARKGRKRRRASQ